MKQHEEGNKFDLMKYRMESAKSDLKSAKQATMMIFISLRGKNRRSRLKQQKN